MVQFTKAWNHKNDGNYGQKEVWLNIDFEIKLVEGCRLNNKGVEVECTRIVYDGEWMTILGTPRDFFAACKNSNTAMALLSHLIDTGLTMKQFLQQHEGLNGIAN